jgi:hypothetical protein
MRSRLAFAISAAAAICGVLVAAAAILRAGESGHEPDAVGGAACPQKVMVACHSAPSSPTKLAMVICFETSPDRHENYFFLRPHGRRGRINTAHPRRF